MSKPSSFPSYGCHLHAHHHRHDSQQQTQRVKTNRHFPFCAADISSTEEYFWAVLPLTHSLIRDSSIRLTHQLQDEIFFERKRKKALLMFISCSQTCSSFPPKGISHRSNVNGAVCKCKGLLRVRRQAERARLRGRQTARCVGPTSSHPSLLLPHPYLRTCTIKDVLHQHCTEALEESCALWKNYERGCRRVVAQSCQVYKPRYEAVVTLPFILFS